MLASWYDPFAKGAAWLMAAFYAVTHSYAASLALLGVVVIIFLTPLTLKSTKGMLEMQKLQPEMKRLQAQYKSDRQRLNEEMMKLYQEHKVNPLASCLPLVAQLPVFLLMYRVIRGLSNRCGTSTLANCTTNADGTLTSIVPKYVKSSTQLYKSLLGQFEMKSLSFDLSQSPATVLRQNLGSGIKYAVLIIVLGALYWFQQRQIASRQVNPSMSAQQQKLMQYLPIFFAVFQLFLPTGLVVYYISQTVLRIAQQAYVTRRFYKGDDSLGKQAAAAGAHARELAQAEKNNKLKDDTKKAGPSRSTSRSSDNRTPPRQNPGAKGAANRPGTAKPGGPKKTDIHQSKNGAKGSDTNGRTPPKPANRPPSGSRHPKPNK